MVQLEFWRLFSAIVYKVELSLKGEDGTFETFVSHFTDGISV